MPFDAQLHTLNASVVLVDVHGLGDRSACSIGNKNPPRNDVVKSVGVVGPKGCPKRPAECRLIAHLISHVDFGVEVGVAQKAQETAVLVNRVEPGIKKARMREPHAVAVVEVEHMVGRHREGHVEAWQQTCLPSKPCHTYGFVEVVGSYGIDYGRVWIGNGLVRKGSGSPHVHAQTQGCLQPLVGNSVLDEGSEFSGPSLPNVVGGTNRNRFGRGAVVEFDGRTHPRSSHVYPLEFVPLVFGSQGNFVNSALGIVVGLNPQGVLLDVVIVPGWGNAAVVVESVPRSDVHSTRGVARVKHAYRVGSDIGFIQNFINRFLAKGSPVGIRP